MQRTLYSLQGNLYRIEGTGYKDQEGVKKIDTCSCRGERTNPKCCPSSSAGNREEMSLYLSRFKGNLNKTKN